MIKLVDYCHQPRSYADSRGECVIQLEGNETIQDVINTYVNVKRSWWEQSYRSPHVIHRYIYKTCYGQKIFTGNMILLETNRVYLD